MKGGDIMKESIGLVLCIYGPILLLLYIGVQNYYDNKEGCDKQVDIFLAKIKQIAIKTLAAVVILPLFYLVMLPVMKFFCRPINDDANKPYKSNEVWIDCEYEDSRGKLVSVIANLCMPISKFFMTCKNEKDVEYPINKILLRLRGYTIRDKKKAEEAIREIDAKYSKEITKKIEENRVNQAKIGKAMGLLPMK